MAQEIYRKSLSRFLATLAFLLVLSVVTIFSSLLIGPAMMEVSFVDIFKVLFLGFTNPSSEGSVNLIAMLRFSRTIASFFLGVSLAVAGTLMQTVTRNPLADPYIFGLSSTALTAIAITIIVAPSFAVLRYNLIVVAFVGALIGYSTTLALARLAGGDSLALVLAGIAVAALFSGASHVLLYVVQSVIRTPYVYFLMGTANTVLLRDLPYITYPTIVLSLVALIFFKPLNTYLYGDEYAKQLGFNPRTVSFIAATLASLLTATTVAFMGIVGFVGLASPHIARFFVGSDHRYSIPTAALVGGILTTLSDIVVRLISMYARAVGELPLGAITSIIGAPFLAYLVVKRVRR